MSLPSLTKNEKLILGSVVAVLILFSTTVGVYVWYTTRNIVSFDVSLTKTDTKLSSILNSVPTVESLKTNIPTGPFDAEVVFASDTEVLLSTILQRGKTQITLANKPLVKIFNGNPPEATPANFVDLKAGQIIRMESDPEQEVRLYILE